MNIAHSLRIPDPQDRFGQRVARRLSDAENDLPHDISERLRFARAQALGKLRQVAVQEVADLSITGGVGSLHAGGGGNPIWVRIGSLLPLIALVAGLMTISIIADDNRTNEMAAVDAELLTDELPPDAYTDPGFAQFLRVKQID
jgi:hypothetical protein